MAIELAAARIDMFGLRGLAAVLNEHLLLLAQGHRTAQPRQQSLLGALDWSYRLLSPVEQTILQRLAVFRGDFTLEAAIAVAAGDGISVEQIYAGMLTLSTKSLITTDVIGRSAAAPSSPASRHAGLRRSQAARIGERRGRIVRRHAEYLCRLLDAGGSRLGDNGATAVAGDLRARTIDDVRAALDWAFSPEGDAAIGVALSAWPLAIGLPAFVDR